MPRLPAWTSHVLPASVVLVLSRPVARAAFLDMPSERPPMPSSSSVRTAGDEVAGAPVVAGGVVSEIGDRVAAGADSHPLNAPAPSAISAMAVVIPPRPASFMLFPTMVPLG